MRVFWKERKWSCHGQYLSMATAFISKYSYNPCCWLKFDIAAWQISKCKKSKMDFRQKTKISFNFFKQNSSLLWSLGKRNNVTWFKNELQVISEASEVEHKSYYKIVIANVVLSVWRTKNNKQMLIFPKI